jgi:lipid-binding SYLF domain-containing protein
MIKKLVSLLLTMIVTLSAGNSENAKVIESANVIKTMLHLPENAIPPVLFEKAEAVAIIPSTYKVGFIFGGRYGNGVMVAKNEQGVWGNPVFINLMGGSVGLQIGASSSDIVLVFKTKKSLDGLISSKLTLGVDASIAAGPVGREAGLGGDLFLEQEVYSYATTKGLYAGLSLAGNSIVVDQGANIRFYGTDVSPTDIFNNYQINAPEVVKVLDGVFN